MTHLYAIQRDILEFLDDRASADTTAIRRQLAYTADVSVTYDALEPHLNQLEAGGYIEAVSADGPGATYYRRADAAAVQPQTASD
jgi:DNA-binding PadR family transcriptional regulator